MVLLSTSAINVWVAIVCWQRNFTEESLLSRASFTILCTVLILNLFVNEGIKFHSPEPLKEDGWETSVCPQVKCTLCILLSLLLLLLLFFCYFYISWAVTV